MERIWSLFEGTSGYEVKHWPPKGTPILINEPNETNNGEKLTVLGQIRSLMNRQNIGIYLVMEQDEHQSEYVADCDRRIRYVSGFTGSSAFVSIGMDWAELATDSRYYVIASRELGPEWKLRKLGLPGVDSWDQAVVQRAIECKVDVGVDPRFINAEVALKLEMQLAKGGRKLVALKSNLVDRVWGSCRPPLPSTKIISHPLSLTGELADQKIKFVRQRMAERGAQSLGVYNLEDIAWVLNLRGGDVPYVPIFKSFLIVTAEKLVLYTDRSKLSVDLWNHEGLSIYAKDYNLFFNDVSKAQKPIWVPGKGSWAIIKAITHKKDRNEEDAIFDFSPINLKRAIKNSAEISGIREAQLKCSLSIVQYLSWLKIHIDDRINEYDGGLKLLEIRKQLPDFKGNSFETISATGANASAPHYTPPPMGSAVISKDKIYLLDSGSQFLQGSTDITRTVHYGKPTADEIKAYTLVLKGQIAVSSFVFPEGTSGWKLDILARQFLWQHAMDYGHGTGHGIGSYLNIHELPLGIGMTNGPESNLMPGHFVSDEPGYYEDDVFGVRLENDIFVVEKSNSSKDRKYLTFEVMTLVPYDRNLLDEELLTQAEKDYINTYHQTCWDKLNGLLHNNYEVEWLKSSTRPIV